MLLPFPDALDVPLFPLPGVVLFPGALLPLRVFEPRYVALLNDALGGDKLIGMAQLKETGFAKEESAEADHPPVFDVLGVGRIVAHEKLADGTSHIALIGQARGKIEAEHPHEPYRKARIVTLRDVMPVNSVEREQLRRATYAMKETARALAARTLQGDPVERLREVLDDCTDPGLGADLLASLYVRDHQLRQSLLESINVFERIRILRVLLSSLLTRAYMQAPTLKIRNDEICLN